MKPTTKKVIAGISAAAVVAFGLYAFKMYQKGMMRVAAMSADVMPKFEELKEGPRAKVIQYFGIDVGKTTLEQAKTHVKTWNLDCADTSMRALMQAGRDAKKKEIEEVKAKGGDVDAISGASMVDYRSKKERNPQVRMSCNVKAPDVKDRTRADDVEGRFLFVHDSANHPVRHVSFRRMHKNHPAAWDDVKVSIAAMTKVFGAPHKASELPAAAEDGSIRFPKFKKFVWRWEWSDLKAEVTATNMARGVDVNESVEVPWPTRSDAPSLGKDARTSPPPRIQPPNPLTPELKTLLDEMDAKKKAKKRANAATKKVASESEPSNKLSNKNGENVSNAKRGKDAIEKARKRAIIMRDAKAKARKNAKPLTEEGAAR